MLTTRRSTLAAALAALAATAPAQIVIDGTRDAAYGDPIAVQDTATGFGNNNRGSSLFANGSEINGLFAYRDNQHLYLFFAMNLESNFNKFDIFIDTGTGTGENRLLFGQSNANFNALARMADDAPDSGNGIKFDSEFAPTYWMTTTGGETAPFQFGMFPDFAPIGAPRYNDAYLGRHDGTTTGLNGGNARGIEVGFDNSNTAGVGGGNGLDANASTGLNTGFEVKIPLEKLGYPSGPIQVSGMVNGLFHDFLSNQVIPGIGGGGNLGEPRGVDFSAIAGNQAAAIDGPAAPVIAGTVDFDGKVPSALEIEVREANTNNLVGDYIVQVGRDGRFQMGFPAEGAYVLAMRPAGYLRRVVQVATGNMEVAINLVNGDIDGDGSITVFDYDILSTYFDRTSEGEGWDTDGENGFAPRDADLDDDGAVTVFDYDILSRNFDRADD